MWWSAKLLYKAVHSRNGRTIQPGRNMYEESVIVLQANKLRDAEKKALSIAKTNENRYLNEKGELVKWKLIQLVEIQELQDKLKDGLEVSSRLFKNMSAFRKVDALVKRNKRRDKQHLV